jgi:DNA-binding GntR family transcriptional regulator
VPAGPLLPSLGKHRTLEELAYGDIRRAIVDGSLPPGRRIVPNSLAAAAGVSRIPVLQALRRLESEGFVRITPHKEVVVTELHRLLWEAAGLKRGVERGDVAEAARAIEEHRMRAMERLERPH